MNDIIRTPEMIAGEINLIKEQVRSTALQASIEIGRRLQEAKGMVPVGDWHTWLADNVDYSVRTAQNLMALAAECDAGRGASLEKFPYSKAVLLLSMSQDERDEFVEDHDVDGMSVRELKAQLDALKEKNNELQISMDELMADQTADQSAAEGMKAEIAELKEQLAKATQAVEQAKEMSRGMQQQSREAADKLRKDLKAAQDETAQAKRDLKAAQAEAETEKKQLEKALKDASQPVIQQVTPPDVLQELDDPSPYLRGIVAELGFHRAVVPYTQQKRRAGKTSNNFATLYDAAMQSFAAYTKAPIRMMMLLGVLLFLGSLGGGIASLILALRGGVSPVLPLASLIGFFGSLQLIFLSVLGEYLLFLRSKTVKRPIVIEERCLNFDQQDC